ncbi:MAG TPA: hypothetical protein VJW20_11055 [Candidatus Angelobacter sp.]|nr:hypothetical protein [Candidatus Angelobacter sp.]
MADTNNLKTWQEAAAASKDCLPLEVLERFTEDAPADTKAAAHLESCAHCQTELSLLKDFEAATPSTDEGAAVAWITAKLQRQQLGGSAKPKPVAQVSFWRNLFRVPYMAGAAAMAAVLVLAISLYHPEARHPKVGGPGNIGVFRSGEVKLLSPTGDQSQSPSEFRWETVPGAVSYRVDLMDALDTPLASATTIQPQARQAQLQTTPEMKAAMQARMPIKWKVTAMDASGKKIAESSGGSFKIK